jgi:hypothetical protein
VGCGKRLIQRGLFIAAPNQIIVVAQGASSCWGSGEHEVPAPEIATSSIPMSYRRVQNTSLSFSLKTPL